MAAALSNGPHTVIRVELGPGTGDHTYVVKLGEHGEERIHVPCGKGHRVTVVESSKLGPTKIRVTR